MKIFCLFSVDNNFDQPSHNLVCFWTKRPSMVQLAQMLGIQAWPNERDEDTLNVVKVWQGNEVRIGNTDFRLEEIDEGKKL